MSKSRVPSYRHHRPSGQAVVTLNGRDIYLGPWQSTASKTEYDRIIGEWLANGRRLPVDDDKEDLRICELLCMYRDFARTYYVDEEGNPGKEFVCMEAVIRPLKERYSRTRIREFGPLSLKAIRQDMIDRDLCRQQVNQRINRIRRIFRWGVENELVPPEVLQAMKALTPLRRGRSEARESEPVQPVLDEHVDPVLSHVARQVAVMIDLQRLTGMRPGEVVIMRPENVDRTGDVWIYIPTGHKTKYRGHHREIYIGPKAQQLLKPWLLRDAQAYCFSPIEAENERQQQRRAARQTPMTPSQARRSPKGKPQRGKRERYCTGSYCRAIKYGILVVNKLNKKEGRPLIPKWSPNRLRHTCGTRMRRDYGLDVAQVILGHRSAEVTQVYAEADRARAVLVMKEVG